ncbi:hypothetical protein EON81_13405 [bacterium]|nr:MAG: hypothetical protein EON81_13405 [bacterium]
MSANSEVELLRAKVSVSGVPDAVKGIATLRREATSAAKEITTSNRTLKGHAAAAREASVAAERLGGIAAARGTAGLRRMRSEAEGTAQALQRTARATEDLRKKESLLGHGAGALKAAAVGYGIRGAYNGVLSSVKATAT